MEYFQMLCILLIIEHYKNEIIDLGQLEFLA